MSHQLVMDLLEPPQAAARCPAKPVFTGSMCSMERAVARSEGAGIADVLEEFIGGAASVVVRVLDQIVTADEAIKRFCAAYPHAEERLNRAFMAMRWQLNCQATERVFRAHVDELLDRVVRGESLEEGTMAEVLMTLSDFSVREPMSSQPAALFDEVFNAIWREESPIGKSNLHEPWDGANAQLLAELRMKLKVETRTLT